MLRNRLVCAAVVLGAGAVLMLPGFAAARQAVVTGSLALGYEYWERDYDEEPGPLLIDSDEGDRRDWLAWPEIEVQYSGIHDTLGLRYAPVIRYDEVDDTDDIDHYLTLAADRQFSRKWRASLRDKYAMSSDPTRSEAPFLEIGEEEAQVPGAGDEGGEDMTGARDEGGADPPAEGLTQNLGRRQYWTNSLGLETTYAYAQEGEAGLGYEYRVLRNDNGNDLGDYDEYDRHDLAGSLSRRLSAAWRSELGLRYVQGQYDDETVITPPGEPGAGSLVTVSRDLEEYWADVLVDYSRSQRDTFPFMYRYREAAYEDFRDDIWVHELAAGWIHSFDSRTRLQVGGGPSYVDSDDQDGEVGLNAIADFSRDYQHANFDARLSKSYRPRNFTGTDDTGLTDTVEARADFTYRITKDLASTVFGLYRYEDILDPQGVYFQSAVQDSGTAVEDEVGDISYERDIFSLGAALEYTFWRWFTASLRYVYYSQDGDILQDSYDDHRLTFQIAAAKELWRF